MSIYTKIVEHYENYAKRETLKHLREMPERQLVDLGFSLQLIEEGVQAWPWRENEDALPPIRMDSVASFEARQRSQDANAAGKAPAKNTANVKDTQRTAA
jgi:uncharacterized protein YjiS (DUF1127 family)